jgi:hypothetical protein
MIRRYCPVQYYEERILREVEEVEEEDEEDENHFQLMEEVEVVVVERLLQCVHCKRHCVREAEVVVEVLQRVHHQHKKSNSLFFCFVVLASLQNQTFRCCAR